MIVWFSEQPTFEHVGGKGHHLCRMFREGLPIPAGFCVTARGLENPDIHELRRALAKLGAAAFAVRSSAMQEDRAAASFAGMYPTRLNVITPEGVLEALCEIRQSSSAIAAAGYSQRRNVADYPRMAAVVQRFVAADASGVVFTRNPIDGSPSIVVEGSWGLGEAVVAGLVKPDRWTLSTEGHVTASSLADKDTAIVAEETGGTKQIKIEAGRRRQACLNPDSLQTLVTLAKSCERLFDAPQDIEWAFASGGVWLLQSRPITT